jgi:hypothetical protein
MLGITQLQASRYVWIKKVMKCTTLVAISSTLCFSTATRYTRNNIFISLFAYCRHLKRFCEMYSRNMIYIYIYIYIYIRILRLCTVSPVLQRGSLDSIPASTPRWVRLIWDQHTLACTTIHRRDLVPPKHNTGQWMTVITIQSLNGYLMYQQIELLKILHIQILTRFGRLSEETASISLCCINLLLSITESGGVFIARCKLGPS